MQYFKSQEKISATKVTVLGSQKVGKTSLMNRMVLGKFSSHYTTTIGIDFFKYKDDSLSLELLDTPGVKPFRNLIPENLPGSRIIMLVFSVDDRASFEEVTDFLNMAKASNDGDVTYLVG